jgi:uncharacterized membrane-anchored protein
MSRWGLLAAAMAVLSMTVQAGADDTSPAQPQLSAEQQAFMDKLRALKWVEGPITVPVAGNSTLAVPAGYVFLDAANTAKFLELNRNFSNGKEVMISPSSLEWSAYLEFDDAGLVKDDEKIDAPELLKSLKQGTEESNADRKRRGWPPLHIVDWARAPAYNNRSKRLEWATLLESDTNRSVNFFTKVLGRRGYTSVVLVVEPAGLTDAETALNTLLGGYAFNDGERYAEWKEGDKVAEYGLAALVLGGAAAIATKKGFWAVLAGFLATAWKFLAAAAFGGIAWLRSLFKKKE